MFILHQFLQMMVTERGATRATICAYEADLDNFFVFLKNKNVETVALHDIQSYLITQNHLAPSTRARRLSSLRQFYTFLVNKGTIKENLFVFVKSTPLKSSSSSLLSQKEITSLFEEAKTWEGIEGKRLSALLQIFYAIDISVNDLVSLTVKDDRIENLSTSALEILRDYMLVRPYFFIDKKESPWLFPSTSQKGHLTRQRFGQLLKELSLKVSLDPKCIL